MQLSGINNSREFSSPEGDFLEPKRVVDIILDINHPLAKEYGGYDSIGTIFYTDPYDFVGEEVPSNKEFARPLFSFVKQYPLKNEIVLVLTSVSKNIYNVESAATTYYLPNINIWNHPHHNALPDTPYTGDTEEDDTLEKYKLVDGGVTRTPEDGSVDIKLGDYFSEKLNLQPLLPFEGDTIIEGRFGNSIRIGATAKEAKEKTAYSTKGKTGDPIMILRNGQLLEERDLGWEHTIENINTDDSTIYLTSNQVLPNFEIVSQHFQSWQAEYDYLDVSDSKDDFDNITLGSPAEKIEIEEEEDIPYEGDGLEDDNDNDEEQTPKFVKNVNLWNGEITYINADIATESDVGGYEIDPDKYAEIQVDYVTKEAYEASQSQSEDIKDLEGREEEILEEEGSIYDLLLEQDNFDDAEFDWDINVDEWENNADPEKENEHHNKEDIEKDQKDDKETEEGKNDSEEGEDNEENNETDGNTNPDVVETETSGSAMVSSSLTPSAVENSYFKSDINVTDDSFKNQVKTYGTIVNTIAARQAAFKKNVPKAYHNLLGTQNGTASDVPGWRILYNYAGRKFLLPKPAPLSIAIQKWRIGIDSTKTVHWTDKRTLANSTGASFTGRSSVYKDSSGKAYALASNVDVKYLCLHVTAGNPRADGIQDIAPHLHQRMWPSFGYNWLIHWDGNVIQAMPDYASGVSINGGSKKYASTWGETTHATNTNCIQLNWVGGGYSYYGGTVGGDDFDNKGKEKVEYIYGIYDKFQGLGDIEKGKINGESLTEKEFLALGSGRYSHTAGYGTLTDKQLIVMKELIYIYIKRYPNIKIFGHNQVYSKACPWIWTPTYLEYILDAKDDNNPLHTNPDDYHDRDYYIAGSEGKRGLMNYKTAESGYWVENAKDAGLRATGKKGIEKTVGWKKHGSDNFGKTADSENSAYKSDYVTD